MNYLVEGTSYVIISLFAVYISVFLGELINGMIDKMKEKNRGKRFKSVEKVILKKEIIEKKRA